MKIAYSKILDVLFVLFIISIIAMPQSLIGKGFQGLFILASLSIAFLKEKKISLFHIFELLFVLYIFFQVFVEIAIVKSITLSMGITMIYSFTFSLGLYNYLIYQKNLQKVIDLYGNASIFAFLLILILYFPTLNTFRLNTLETIKFFEFTVFGGASSTALAIMAAVPAFFWTIFPPKNSRKLLYIVLVFFMMISLLTGTRKTLILFIFYFVINAFLKKQDENFHFVKTFAKLGVGLAISFCVLMYVPFFYNTIGNRIENMVLYFHNETKIDASINARTRMISRAKKLFDQSPLFGWGMDYFKGSQQSELGYYSHNNFLEILSGGGIVGFVLFYSKYVYLLIRQVKACFKQKSKKSLWLCSIGFMLLMTILEYWQVTYFYRYISIYQILILYMLHSIHSNEEMLLT